ncbi:hypothetical protein CK203_104155 [Vitis vinifera]|uniref:Uncharacterized protein n=1 Tax=Vitis vinifera TaxID=29760 RepID=A0A438FHN6_VITVI|nr:hypothetical protein CK203_104155 [Vitis vinifera]
MRAMVCECPISFVDWAKVVRALARFLGQKGVVTIVPFSIGKGLFFVDIVEKASFLQELRFFLVKGRYTVQLRWWSPRENTEVLWKFRGGWIELQGLPFHLWSKEHLKKIVEQWGTVVEINWRTVKLFDLSKARVRISMKECTVLPALIKIDGKRMVEKANPMAKGWSFNGDFGKIQGGSQKGEDAFEGTHGKKSASVGNNYVSPFPLFNLNSNKESNGIFGLRLFGEDMVRGVRPIQALRNGQEMDGVQPKARKGSLCKEDSSLLVSIAKGMIVSKAFSSQLGGSMPKIGLKKLWTRLSPPISSCQQGLRRQSRPLLQEVLTSHKMFNHGTLLSKWDHRRREVHLSQSPTYQVSEGINSLKTLPSMPSEGPNLFIECPVEAEFSSSGGFQIEGLSPNKMARVHLVLSSMDIRVDRVSFRSPFPSPKAFRSTVSPSENPHHRQKTLIRRLFATFSASPFPTDHTIRCARRRSSSFVKAPEGDSQPRVFLLRRLNLTRRHVRARGALSGHALPPPASPDAV